MFIVHSVISLFAVVRTELSKSIQQQLLRDHLRRWYVL